MVPRANGEVRDFYGRATRNCARRQPGRPALALPNHPQILCLCLAAQPSRNSITLQLERVRLRRCAS
jgi:hypothetical protein